MQHDGDVTVAEAVAMRGDHATLAAHYAGRAEQARAAGQYGAMRHWMHEYRRATRQCRLLGDRIRRVDADFAAGAAEGARVVVPLVPRPAADVPPAGEAA
jgi:hypothetical protein